MQSDKRMASAACESWRSAFCLFLGLCWASASLAGQISVKPVKLKGKLHEDRDISAIEQVGEWLYVAADEGRDLQRLKGSAGSGYAQASFIGLKDGKLKKHPSEGDEFDLEAMAYDGERSLYMVGSHSAKRQRLKGRERVSADTNIKYLASIQSEKARRVLYRLRLDPQGLPMGKAEKISLWKAINDSPLLKPFTRIPSKENGIDIEGLAVAGDTLYVGFRGPVLRENYVPVLVGRFNDLSSRGKLKFVRLGGLGIRSMLSLGKQGFLILAGPVGDGPGGFHLYHWNGRDQLPAKGDRGRVSHLGEISVREGDKPEGMTLVSQQGKRLQLLIAFDGAKNGALSLLKVNL